MATQWKSYVLGLLLSCILSSAVARSDDAKAQWFFPVDLQPFVNQKLNNDFHTFPGNNLKLLPRGKQHLGEIDFLIGNKFIQMASKMAADFPERISGIPVRRTVTKLHFFHGVGWSADDGYLIGEYLVHYVDGTTDTIPIEYGLDVRDWWMYEFDKKETPRAVIAWKGMNHASKKFQDQRLSIRLYRRTWENPHPNKQLESFDVVSRNEDQTAPFLIAVTAESTERPEGDPFVQPAVTQSESGKNAPPIDQALTKEVQESIQSLLEAAALLEYDDKQMVIGVGMVRLTDETQRGTNEAVEWTSRLLTVQNIDLNSAQIAHDTLIPLKKLPNLKRLSLNFTSISSEALKQIKEMPTLERLRLHGTAMTDAGLAELSQLLNLKILDLSQTPVTDEGLVHLESLKSLEELDLRNTQVTEAGANKLRERLPTAKVLTKPLLIEQ